jgi:hypothetical protein
MAEHSAVNRRVVGSSPTSGAKTLLESVKCEAAKTAVNFILSGGCFGGCCD